MIAAAAFLEPARRRGYDFFTGVPCSFLTPFINRAISDRSLAYVGAASEGEAVAIAAGAWLAGHKTVVMCQNSGLGNAVNPLTSLNAPFRIPTLLITTWRGRPGLADEPQHALMGEITGALLDVLRIPRRPFPDEDGNTEAAIAEADRVMEETHLPFAFVMEKDSVRDEDLKSPPPPTRRTAVRHDHRRGGALPRRIDVLERVQASVPPSAALIATTGKCGRELFTLGDRPQQLYVVGSMGGASGLGLGVALNWKRRVIILDGDGAALMKLGTLATIGAQGPANLVHVIIDNGVHDSTGGQATVSSVVDFAAVAADCNYARAHRADDLDGFGRALADALAEDGPSLIHVHVRPGSISDLGRPTVSPADVARRFKAHLASASHLPSNPAPFTGFTRGIT